MPLTMPEEILLLMLEDESGRLMEGLAAAGDCALAGAILAELLLAGRIGTGPDRLAVLNPTPTGDALQDEVLRILAAGPATDSRHWIETLAGKAEHFREILFGRLIAKGILKEEEGRFLWVFPERRYPTVSDREEREVKARIMGVLFHEETPDTRDALLIGICRAADLFRLMLASGELEHMQPRIDALADREELSRSLSGAVQEIYAQIARYAPVI
jgi:hypothetical protein